MNPTPGIAFPDLLDQQAREAVNAKQKLFAEIEELVKLDTRKYYWAGILLDESWPNETLVAFAKTTIWKMEQMADKLQRAEENKGNR